MSTFAQLSTKVLNTLVRTDKTQVVLDGLNEGLQEFCKLYAFKELYSESSLVTVANTETVTLPTGTVGVKELRLIDGSNSYTMRLKDRTWIRKRFPNLTSTTASRPIFCFRDATTLYLAPLPNAVYTIKLSLATLPVDKTSTDSNPIPLLDAALVAYAIGYVFESLQQFDTSDRFFMKATRLFKLAQAKDLEDEVELQADGFRSEAIGSIDEPSYDISTETASGNVQW